MNKLCLHCGANEVSFEHSSIQDTPESTGRTHNPISHALYLNMIADALDANGLMIREQALATNGNDTLFGLMEVASKGTDSIMVDGIEIDRIPRDAFSTLIGVRGSHDKTVGRGLVGGNRTFVCDNLMFNGEIKFSTKHTTEILSRLPELIYGGILKVKEMEKRQIDRIDAYQSKEITDDKARAMITHMLDKKIISSHDYPHVIEQWKDPRYPQFAANQDVYRLVQAVTDGHKPKQGGNAILTSMLPKSIKLTNFMDDFVGLPELQLAA